MMQKIKNIATFGLNLRSLRVKNHFTQEYLVTQLNLLGIDISRGQYSRYETGELNVPVQTLVALRQIYKCSYDEFFKDIEIRV